MTMKKILTILFLLLFAMSCEKEDLVLSEREKIEVKYLQSTRGMVIAADTVNVIQENPPFYNVFGRYAYRHIVNYYDAERKSKLVVEWGDKIEIRFKAYIFSGSEPSSNETSPSSSAIYWSNVPEIIQALGEKTIPNGPGTSDDVTINTLDWSTDPLTIHLGTTEIIEGLERTLPGCREADSVQVYISSNLAYGNHLMGVVPKNSMVAWYMKIEKVTK